MHAFTTQKNMATVKLVLDIRRKKQSGKFPLVIRVRHNNSYFDITTGAELELQEFDQQKQKIKNQPERSKEIQQLYAFYSNKLLNLLAEGHSFESAKKLLLNKSKSDATKTLHQFWLEEIDRLTQSCRAGGARVYKSSLGGLAKVINLKIHFKELMLKDLLKAELELKKAGVSTNSIAVYMRTLRAICNRAINLDLVAHSWYPFRKYNIRKEKTVTRALNAEEMQRYFSLNFNPSDKLYYAHRIGMLIFLLRGVNFKDLMLVSNASIINNRIFYIRSKTGKHYNINQHPLTIKILNEFVKEDVLTLLPANVNLKNLSSDLDALNKYMQLRKVINAHLRKIGKMINASTPLTTYVFRYSYANIAKSLGFSKDLIAEALGHEYGNTVTGIYLDMFDSEKLDEMHNAIVEKIIGV